MKCCATFQPRRRAERPSDFPRLQHHGDGLVAALQMLRIMKGQSAPLSRVVKCWTRFRNLVTNILVREKRPFAELDGVPKLVAQAEADLKAQGGRLLLRYSGTEPKARLLLERPRRRRAREVVEANCRGDQAAGWSVSLNFEVHLKCFLNFAVECRLHHRGFAVRTTRQKVQCLKRNVRRFRVGHSMFLLCVIPCLLLDAYVIFPGCYVPDPDN